jgi:hypothetical protein
VINEMGNVTQKNASLVEEANSTSTALAKESGQLRQLVAKFGLPLAINETDKADYSGERLAGQVRPARAGTANGFSSPKRHHQSAELTSNQNGRSK